MRRLFTCICAALVSGTTLAADPAANSINQFGIVLLDQLGTPGENTVISPFSIQLALGMTYAGARDETKEQMARTLFYPKGETIHGSFHALQQELDALAKRTTEIAARSKKEGGPSDPITLEIANRLYGQSGYDFRADYLGFLKKEYGAPMEQVNFVTDAPGITKQINSWVEKQTRDRIKNLIPAGALTRDSHLVLVNALYLKAPWQSEFQAAATKPDSFHLVNGKTVTVPTMTKKDDLGYAKLNGCTAVALPYIGEELQLLILLPDESSSISALQKKLDSGLLEKCAKLETSKLLLHLPKFRVEPKLIQLAELLKKDGMTNAFDMPQGSANFDGIAPKKPDDYLYISEIFHKTFLEIDEKGTEAAAATAVVMMRATAMPVEEKSIEVRVDRPFLIAIQHKPSGACLFLGRIANPAP